MTDISEILQARAELREAHDKITNQAKSVISDLVMEIFEANPSAVNVAWASKSSEYDDQGMYPGIHGPVFDVDDDDTYPDWTYSYGGTSVAAELKPLRELLDAIGEEILSDLFGDEVVVVVNNPKNNTGVFKVRHVGY